MSYRYQDGQDFEIYTAPPPPQTARELVEQLGSEAVRDALPSDERLLFDQANPWSEIQRAHELLQYWMNELQIFDSNVERNIATQGYTPDQAQVVYQQTEGLRQGLTEDVRRSQEIASSLLNTYENNLIHHIESRGLTQRVALRTGLYSTPELSVSQAASLYSPGLGGHDHRRGRQGRRPPLGSNSGDRRQPRRRG